ncbi:hypothetical protein F4778DRAFT_585507 [Xylariomycetidae sp. FL2044]|nr:hypothetical protein F4778DRAFT_585507 [Xylariomycetidae sp. FL2044]
MAGNMHFNGPMGPSGPPREPDPRPGLPPPPARTLLPVHLRGGPVTQVSDVSQHFRSEADMIADLTEFVVFRFEKMPEQRYDEETGRPRLPTWDKAIRTEVRMTQKEIARQIKHLNHTSQTAVDKKNLLSPVLQRQIDHAQAQLIDSDHDPINYQWVLAQVDHQLKEIDPRLVYRGRHGATLQKHRSASRRSTGSHPSRRRRRAYERISLTAYFKRLPREHAHVSMLWEAKRRMPLTHPHPMAPPAAMNPGGGGGLPPDGRGPPRGPFHPGGGGGRWPADVRVQGGPPADMRGQGGPPRVPMNAGKPVPGGGGPVRPGAKGEAKWATPRKKRRESDSDYSSESSSACSSDMTPATSRSSGSSKRRGGRGNSKNRRSSQMPEKSRPYHSRSGPDGRHKPRPLVVEGGSHAPRAPVAPMAGPRSATAAARDFERAREDAYLAGRRDEQDRVREREVGGPRVLPRIIQTARSPGPFYRTRAVGGDAGGPHRRRDMDLEERLARMSLADLSDGYGSEGLRREYEYRMQGGSILGSDPFARDTESDYSREASGFMRGRGFRRQYGVPYVTDVPDGESDFSPLARPVRLYH